MLWHKLIGFAILSLALTQLEFVQSDVPASGCRNNFSSVAGKCLYASKNWLNWYEADRTCRSLGAELLSVQNQTQLQQIEKWLNTTLPFTLDFWTSGNSLGQKGVYFWQSNGEQARNMPWSPGQPRSADGDCLSLIANKLHNTGYYDYGLKVNNCTFWASIVCEQQPQKYNTRICLQPGSFENAQVLA
ncbi:macrophage mannose receptor 1-like [Drosophila innubila]|uniref:macrophage mannose receptor 1-like n=1 Tax=Drosophila innubila TaxID=198719 RepID=UPI00148E4C28|nr:macrophage mannose receptor 1-like [Drosophila innubila]